MSQNQTTGSDFQDFLLCEATGERWGRWKNGEAERQEALRLIGVLDDKKMFEKRKRQKVMRNERTSRGLTT